MYVKEAREGPDFVGRAQLCALHFESDAEDSTAAAPSSHSDIPSSHSHSGGLADVTLAGSADDSTGRSGSTGTAFSTGSALPGFVCSEPLLEKALSSQVPLHPPSLPLVIPHLSQFFS